MPSFRFVSLGRESRLKPHDFAVFGKGRRIKCVFVPYLAFPRAPRRLLETKLSLAAYRVHRTLLRHTAVLPGLFLHPTSSKALRALTTRRRRTTNWGFLSARRSAATSVRVRRTLRMAQFLRRKFADLAIKIWEPKMAPIAASNRGHPASPTPPACACHSWSWTKKPWRKWD